MVCKKYFCSKFPDIPEKLWRRRRWRKPTNAQCFAFQANAINCISTCYFKATWNRKPARKSKKALINSSPIKQRSPLDTERKLNVHKMFRRLQGIFWFSYIRSVYVLYPRRTLKRMNTEKKLTYFKCKIVCISNLKFLLKFLARNSLNCCSCTRWGTILHIVGNTKRKQF